MSALPTMSLRVPPEHQALIRAVARALRTRPALPAALVALLAEGEPASAAPLPGLSDVVARLEAVEAWIAGRNAAATPTSAPAPQEPALPRPAIEAPAAGAAVPSGHRTGGKADLAAVVKAARAGRGWSQAELATRAGCALPTVGRLERGLGVGRTWPKIAAALGLDDAAKA